MARILVIDDDADLRGFVRDALAVAGHTTIEAPNGGVGLALLREDGADLVLCDIFMPEMEGMETIRKIRELNSPVPVVAMSGGSPTLGDWLSVAGKIGAVGVLPKPFSPAALNEIVKKHLQ